MSWPKFLDAFLSALQWPSASGAKWWEKRYGPPRKILYSQAKPLPNYKLDLYNPYKWSYTWVTGVISLSSIGEIKTLLITTDGAHLAEAMKIFGWREFFMKSVCSFLVDGEPFSYTLFWWHAFCLVAFHGWKLKSARPCYTNVKIFSCPGSNGYILPWMWRRRVHDADGETHFFFEEWHCFWRAVLPGNVRSGWKLYSPKSNMELEKQSSKNLHFSWNVEKKTSRSVVETSGGKPFC